MRRGRELDCASIMHAYMCGLSAATPIPTYDCSTTLSLSLCREARQTESPPHNIHVNAPPTCYLIDMLFDSHPW